jgi:hypothetical protein
MTLVCDEFGSFIGSMDKSNAYGASAADRAIYLKAYDRRPHKADRIQRKTQFVPMLSLGILAGVQPDRLPAFGDLVSDGLLQRFVQIVVQPMKFAPDDGSGDGRDCVAYGDLVDSLIKIQPKMNFSCMEGRVEPIELTGDGYSAMERTGASSRSKSVRRPERNPLADAGFDSCERRLRGTQYRRVS